MMLLPIMKGLGLVVSDKKIFENLCFDPVTYLCNQLKHFEQYELTLVGDHPGIIPVNIGQNPMSGFRGEDV